VIIDRIVHYLPMVTLAAMFTWVVLPWNGKRLPWCISAILSYLIIYGIKHL